jgi:hypothetical protein
VAIVPDPPSITPDIIRRLLAEGAPPGDELHVDVVACGTSGDWAAAITYVGDPGVALFHWEGAGWVKDSEYSYAVVDGPQVNILPRGLPEKLLSWLSAQAWEKPWDE